MNTRQRDIFLWIVINVGAIGWTFFFGKGKSTTELVAILALGIVVLNLAFFIGVKVRNRGDRNKAHDTRPPAT
jgi:hypothetical protein